MEEIGADPKQWGPCLWNFIFTSIASRYPNFINESNEEHLMIRQYYRNFLSSFQVILPCIYCRKSFSFFLRQDPLTDNVLSSKKKLLYWVYNLKDKVNKKLIQQEKRQYISDKNRIEKLYKDDMISYDEYIKQNKNVEQSFKTVPSPPFDQVFKKYNSL